MGIYIKYITIENPKIDKENFFEIGFCKQIKHYLLSVYIPWVAGYNRYYIVDEYDYLVLYEKKYEEFLKKYEKEINGYRTKRLIGADALRDYDFKSLPDEINKSLDKYPPFDGFYYENDIFYARIKINNKFFIIPPIYD